MTFVEHTDYRMSTMRGKYQNIKVYKYKSQEYIFQKGSIHSERQIHSEIIYHDPFKVDFFFWDHFYLGIYFSEQISEVTNPVRLSHTSQPSQQTRPKKQPKLVNPQNEQNYF